MNFLRSDGTFGRRERSNGWTAAMVDRLKELTYLDSPLSASEIAAKINDEFDLALSRCAIIGKVQREKLKLQDHASATIKQWAGRPRAAPTPRPKRRREFRPIDLATEIQSVTVPDRFIPTEQRCSLMQLNQHTCRWPVGDPSKPDFFFCGADTSSDSPYCAHHHRVGHEPPKSARHGNYYNRNGSRAA